MGIIVHFILIFFAEVDGPCPSSSSSSSSSPSACSSASLAFFVMCLNYDFLIQNSIPITQCLASSSRFLSVLISLARLHHSYSAILACLLRHRLGGAKFPRNWCLSICRTLLHSGQSAAHWWPHFRIGTRLRDGCPGKRQMLRKWLRSGIAKNNNWILL